MSTIREAQKRLIEQHGIDRYPSMAEKLVKLMEEAGELAAAYNKNKELSLFMRELSQVVLTAQNIAEYWGQDVETLVVREVERDHRDFSKEEK